MADLLNCPNCGKLFVKALRSVCNDCAKEVEEKYNKVYQFIRKRENRRATIDEVTEGTDVEQSLIIQFIREGRIHLSQFPNLGYPCEKCGVMIREQRLCHSCAKDLRQGLHTIDRQKEFDARQKKRENAKIKAYASLDNRLNR
ncbi:flagellar operon protein (TIGR03826 family) [Evansella vedderi]|uniref:Flagellar operon protein (TIGR03826 family) n=1 Tax=Evansella vedderi TaxID=38282 RepID=A0ABT9ZUA6_9BACI|nr:TIGR03826 family flagellar region protein [Evansella vedderi]MDQ0254525.1 flagellar operon protein (TIGR03826 family) [Evansella vedderi]